METNKYRVAIFDGCIGLHPDGGTSVRIYNIGKMLDKFGIYYKIFSDNCRPKHPDYALPGRVFKFTDFNPAEFNIYWVEQNYRYVPKLNGMGILPIIGTNIIPCSCSQHCLPYLYGVQKENQEARLANERLKAQGLKGKFWLSQSDFQEKEFRKLGLPYDVPVLRAPNPVDINKFYPIDEIPEKLIIGWSGKDNWQKHPIFLKHIAQAFPNIEFHYLSEANCTLDLGENVVKILGSTNREMPDLLRQCSLVISTSVTEMQPLGLLEAMACGLIVVGFRTSGIPEIIKHNQTGFLVDLGNIDHYIVELNRILRCEYDLGQIRANARQYVVDNFSEEACIAQYLKIFDLYLNTEGSLSEEERNKLANTRYPLKVNVKQKKEPELIEPIVEIKKEKTITEKTKEHFNEQWKGRYSSLDKILFNNNLVKHLLICTNSTPEEWKDKVVFEGGAGSGRNTVASLQLGVKCITATELSDGGAEVISENTKEYEARTKVYPADLTKLEQEMDNTYDIVFTVNCLCHIPEYKQALREMIRICKPGGLIMFNSNTKQNPLLKEVDLTMREYTTNFCKDCLQKFSQMMVRLRGIPEFFKAIKGIMPISTNELSMFDHYGYPYTHDFTKEQLTKDLEELGCEVLAINDYIAVKARKK